jgi:hypothetical protein
MIEGTLVTVVVLIIAIAWLQKKNADLYREQRDRAWKDNDRLFGYLFADGDEKWREKQEKEDK